MKKSIYILTLFFSFNGSFAEAVPGDILKIVMIERITRFIEWPDTYISDKPSDPFIIAFVGDVDFDDTMKSMMQNRLVKNKTVKFIFYKSMPDEYDFHLLIVGELKNTFLPKKNYITNKPVLTVSDNNSDAKSEVMIYLYNENNRLRFNINPELIKKSGLKVDYRLLQYAKESF